MPPPVITTVPLAGWVTEVMLLGPPSESVSLASTSMAVAPRPRSPWRCRRLQSGSSSTQVTVTDTVALSPPGVRV